MKVRKGFVSNSSSSSFVCDVCGVSESGCMNECGKHTYCNSHAKRNIEDLTVEEIRKELIDGAYDEVNKTKYKEMPNARIIEEWQEIIDSGDFEYQPKVICPVCQLDAIPDSVLLKYLLLNSQKKRKEIEDQIRSEYKNLAELEKVLKEKGLLK